MSSWFDLPVRNLSEAMSFYEALLHWQYRQMKDSPEKDYVIIESGQKMIGGLRQVSGSMIPMPAGHAPLLYFTVEELTQATARAKELGAEIVGERVHLGLSRGSYQWIRDREGNLIGLWSQA